MMRDDREAIQGPVRVVKLAPADNVAIAPQPIEAGVEIGVDDVVVRTREPIPRGHKVAMTAIGAGERVRKHGGPIGSASVAIQPGEHVHTHNLQSDYLPTYARGESQRSAS